MEAGENGASGASVPSRVTSECKAEPESAIVPLQLTVVKTAKDLLKKLVNVMRTLLVLVSW